MNVVLIGMKHCGKSTLGAALAARWGCPFYDVDPMIEATHACDRGESLSVREILARHGEAYFAEIEGQAVCDLFIKLSQPDSSSVVALGGRTATNERICMLLAAMGLIVYLKVAADELFTRVQRTGIPPFLAPDDPEGDFHALCRHREGHYRRLAHVMVNLDGLDADTALEALVRAIEEHAHGRQ
ncbi:MAG: hypothetical protein JXA69_16645 [Phycisphaerae bacterium]|nr:hypothetical protein [Phycisphaerae bacterium]